MPLVVPVHEQHFPDKRLPRRLEEYVFDDGRPPTTNRAFARRVTGAQVLDAVKKVQFTLNMPEIDPRYFVGTVFHESGCVNEWDTEIATASCPPGFQSVGAYQIGDEEARRFGYTLPDMLDLDKSTICMVRLAMANRTQLRAYAKLSPATPDPDYTDAHGVVWRGGAMRAYLGIAHNHGLGYARATINRYGLDWPSYKRRNPSDNIVGHNYGEDCVTGGPHWPAAVVPAPVTPGHRTLRIQTPWMTGEDVRELQRHLGITPDGIYGPKTAARVHMFQLGHQLLADGICGDATWAVVLTA